MNTYSKYYVIVKYSALAIVFVSMCFSKAHSFSHPTEVELDHTITYRELDRQDKEYSQDAETYADKDWSQRERQQD